MSTATICSYSVIHCSSYGNDSHPDDLVKSNEQLRHHPDSLSNHAMTDPHIQGWLTTPRCSYPQEIVLCLSNGSTHVDRLDILAHHTMIPSRIDIYLGVQSLSSEKRLIQFNRLGFVSLGDNKAGGYCVRELKSVYIGHTAEYIRLVLWDCHRNMLNQLNQVGLAAIRVVGQKSERHGDVIVSRPPAYSISTVHSDETEVDLKRAKIDGQLATWIDVLIEQKKLCVQTEDYQGARMYKFWSHNLLALGNEIEELEVEKRRAVDVEDFDEAERIKLVIQDKRLDTKTQMAKAGIQITDDGTILIDNYKDHQVEKESDSSASDEVSSAGDHVSETELRSSTTSSNSIASLDNIPAPNHSFIPTLRTSTVLRKSSARSLKSSSSMTSSSRLMETVSTAATTSPSNSNVKLSKVPSDQQPAALISFTPPPPDKGNSDAKPSSHSLPKPSMIPTVSEDTKTSSRTKIKSLHSVKSIPTRIPSPRDKITLATDEINVKKDVPGSDAQVVQEAVVEASPPRRGTVAKLERQLAELRMMAAGSGQLSAKANAESNIPKSNTMLKKTSIETMKPPPLTTIPVLNDDSTITGGVEKKTTQTNKQSKHQNSVTRHASQAKTNERSPKNQSRTKHQNRNDERSSTTKGSHAAKKKPEEKKNSSTCIFCEEQNDNFNEDTLVSHYWNDCPVLTSCPLCQIILEISTLSEHIVTDCEEKHRIKRCPRCKEVVSIDKWLQHSLRQNCTVVSSSETRCPLCREVIMPPTESMWKRHLLKEGGCPHNPRRLTIMDR